MVRYAIPLLLAVLLQACEWPAPPELVSGEPAPNAAEDSTGTTFRTARAPGEEGTARTPLVLEQTLSRLYEAEGDYRRPKPSIALAHSKLFVARYHPRSNRILVENEALQLCRSFGPDSTQALALLLAHELAHYYALQSGGTATNFLAFDKHPDSDADTEMEADLRGIFLCQLAGYSRARELFPRLVAGLYEHYELQQKHLPLYPPLDHRLRHAELVQQRADTLAHIFDAALQLSAFGHLLHASECYEYVLRYYQGSEVFANIGVVQALLSRGQAEGLAFPFELEPRSRLHQVRSGGPAPSAELRRQRALKAREYLSRAYDSNQSAGTLANLLSVQLLLGEIEDSGLLENAHSLLEPDMYRFLQGLWHWRHERDSARALAHFESLTHSRDAQLRHLATYNVQWLQSEGVENPPSPPCPLPVLGEFPGGFRLHELFQHRGLPLQSPLQTHLYWELRGPHTLYSLQSITGRIAFIHTRHEPSTPPRAWDVLRNTSAGKLPLRISGGSIQHFPACGQIFFLNEGGEVVVGALVVGG